MLKRIITFLLFLASGTSSLPAQEIIEVTLLGSKTLQEMQANYGFLAQNGVEHYRVLYSSQDLKGQRDTASGLLILPIKEGDKPLPLLIYQHGTVSAKDDVPSELRGGYEIAEVGGTLGYVSLAPDYTGLGASRGLHPYVHAASEAWTAIDMLKAVKPYLPQLNISVNQQLFITGYSQGGHAAMALHRELEQNYAAEFPVTASAPMSGPYSISGEMKNLFLSDEEYFYPAYLAFTILSYDLVYGLFDELEEYFQPSFAKLIDTNLRTTLSLETLNRLLKTGLKQKHGGSFPKYILQDSILQAVLNNPQHPASLAMADNDVYNWAPKAPTRLIYCKADDQVPYTNSLVAEARMQELGASDIEALDIKSDADHGQCIEPALLATAAFFSSFLDTQTAAEEKAPVGFQAFPNPANGKIYIEGLRPGTQIELLDLKGERKKNWISQGENQELSVSTDWTGLHLLRFTNKERSWTRKVVLQRP